MKFARLSVLLLVSLTMILANADDRASDPPKPKLAVLPATIPAPKDNPPTPEKIALGQQLFFDARLSGRNDMSCATCHAPDKAFGDGLARPKGFDGKILSRNSQTVLNVAFQSRLFWDGRAASLEEQALLPIQSPEEMNQSLDELVRELADVPGYKKQFTDVFGTDVTRDGIAQALAAFQRTLVTSPSPLDQYLVGDKSALSAEAKRGLELFVGDAGCIRCHHGPLCSDGKFYRLGVANTDKGLGAITGRREDNYKFRTPTLRNIAQTAPYMHDGSIKTLDDVVMFYFRDASVTGPDGLELDIKPLSDLSFSDITAMVALLKAMTGAAPKITPPRLP